MYDIIIQNGLIVDGSGKLRFSGSAGIKNGLVVALGDVKGEAREVIDAGGMIVSPGFIDGHTHSDRSALFGSDAWNYLEQGVTLQITGQCGDSPAPGGRDGLIGDTEHGDEESKLAAEYCDTPESFMRRASEVKSGTNLAFLLGHGAVRSRVMGYKNEKPTPSELEEMRDYVRRAMECGYFGYSSGLGYAPSAYADTEELTALAKAMAPTQGVYASHIRSEGDRGIEAVAEAIRVGEEAGTPVVISHLKTVGKKNEGNSMKYIELIEAAISRGVKVYADQYPFIASSAPLSAQVPVKYHEGGHGALMERLADKETRKVIWNSIINEADEFESALYTAGFEGTLVVGSPRNPAYIGKNIAQIAEETGKEPFDAFCDLLIENNGAGGGIYFSQNESDMLRIIAHPRVIGGSDWSDIEKRYDPEHVAGCHPRGIATFPRRIGILRDKVLLSLEEAVASVTSRAAEAYGIKGHGLLAVSAAANITIFDHREIKGSADFIHPFRKNSGIHTVIVNGQVAVRNGSATGVRAGTAVLRTNA